MAGAWRVTARGETRHADRRTCVSLCANEGANQVEEPVTLYGAGGSAATFSFELCLVYATAFFTKRFVPHARCLLLRFARSRSQEGSLSLSIANYLNHGQDMDPTRTKFRLRNSIRCAGRHEENRSLLSTSLPPSPEVSCDRYSRAALVREVYSSDTMKRSQILDHN